MAILNNPWVHENLTHQHRFKTDIGYRSCYIYILLLQHL
jgi:hypothetical protein